MTDPPSGRHRAADERPRRSAHRPVVTHRPVVIGGRIVVGLVAAALVAGTGIGWALDASGTSNAVAAAGNVGVVTQGPPGLAGTAGPATATASATDPTGAHVTDEPAAVPDVPAIGSENILVVGADSRTDAQGNALTAEQQKEIGVPLDGGGVNTDTLLIVHIPAGGGQAIGVSIPRDTWMGTSVVGAPGVTGPDQSGNQVHYLPGKINGFYGTAKYYDEQYLAAKGVSGAALQRESDEAGRTMLIKVIQQFTGIKINHYAEVNLLGFYLMSQAVGGVEVCLNHAVNDRRSGANFHAGYQTVEGKSALAFVRQRHGLAGGDLDRIKRQQAFLDSALGKVLSLGTLTNPSRLSALLDAARRSVVLDTGFDLLTFAQQMRGLAAGKLRFTTIPTTNDTQVTSTDALLADPTQVRAIFGALTADRPLPVATLGGSGSSTATSTTRHTTTAGGTAARTTTASTHGSPVGYEVPCVN